MRPGTKENLALAAKSVLLILGGIIASAAAVDLVVAGVRATTVGYLFAGLALAGLPLAFAFRDAVRGAGRGGGR